MGEHKRREAREAAARAEREAAVREAVPEPYKHMTARWYWDMLFGEDPDDRAIREAHGFTYEDDYTDGSLLCRNGCGRTYYDIAVCKVRECEADRR